MAKTYTISSNQLDIDTLETIVKSSYLLALSPESKKKIGDCRSYLDKKLKSNKEPIYGINTGFGALYNRSISENDLEKLQNNLVLSHACGVGEEVPSEVVKLMMFLKIQGLSYGHSGVQVETVQRLIHLYNNDVLPVIYQQGSLGASGDLAPLAHLSLPLIGMGEVYYKGKKQQSAAVLKSLGIKPLKFKSKEALALLNGTQFMSAYSTWCLIHAQRIANWADVIGGISIDAFGGRPEPFDKLTHEIRPHKGQLFVAKNISDLLEGSELIKTKKAHVQDPYSFRCIPQVHGASRDTIQHVAGVFEVEINSVTDNPTVFPEEDKIISAGNFHGQPLALSLDFLAIALAEFASISERRTYQLISGQRDLPAFLVSNPGLNSGFMIPQYTAASIVSQNKQLCTPASVDSIVSSNGQEDHVSMGANAATKCYKVVENVYRVLAIELFTAVQALELRRPKKTSPKLEKIISNFRKHIPFVSEDKFMSPEIEKSIRFIKEYPLSISK
ncbi:MAG: histidine ammonia-lyase [Bacteroidia bacterium]|nr:histidine ammonia-lyase [Bacteroidia bacterium]